MSENVVKPWFSPHMVGSFQSQHFFAAGCVFADFAIAVIFYPVIKSLFGCCHTQISNLRANINFKIIWKSGKLSGWPNFQTIFNIFAKLIFAFKFNIWVWQHPNNVQKNFIKFVLQNKKWQWLQNQQKDILQQKNVVAGKNLPYARMD